MDFIQLFLKGKYILVEISAYSTKVSVYIGLLQICLIPERLVNV